MVRSLWAEGWRVQRSRFPVTVVVLWPSPLRNLLCGLWGSVVCCCLGLVTGQSAVLGPWGWGHEGLSRRPLEVMESPLSTLQGEKGRALSEWVLSCLLG